MLISRGINLMKSKKLALPRSRYIYIGHEDHFIKILETAPRKKTKQMKPKKNFENL